MAWEKRERGGRYYTRSKRVNGRVVREYLGKGPIIEWVAWDDTREREERLEEQREKRLEMDALHNSAKELTDALGELDTLCDEAVTKTLTVEGFHQHKGQWRRKRES